MFDAFAVPITVHCAIPFTERKYPILDFMADPDDFDIDPAFAANFTRLMGGRSVATLRQEMAERGISIGSNAIQLAKSGSRGVRLGTLQKFADFFGCTAYELIKPASAQEVWPFGSALTPSQFYALDATTVQSALDVLLSAAKRQALMDKLGAPAPAQDARVATFIQPAPAHDPEKLSKLRNKSRQIEPRSPAGKKPGKERKDG